MPIVSESELVAAITRDRAARKRTALVSACFDILGVADVRAIQRAASQADRVIVAVLDDDAVRAKLGPGRPVVPVEDRAELVGGVRGVDYLVVCSAGDLDRLTALLTPDVRL